MKSVFEPVVNIIATHLAKQQQRCVSEQADLVNSGQCMYRNESGLKCAIGALISDRSLDLSTDSINNESASDIICGGYYPSAQKDILDHFPSHIVDMDIATVLDCFQEYHDDRVIINKHTFSYVDTLDNTPSTPAILEEAIKKDLNKIVELVAEPWVA